jgi:hypothetical protein
LAPVAAKDEAPTALPKKTETKPAESSGDGAKPGTIIALDNFRKKH